MTMSTRMRNLMLGGLAAGTVLAVGLAAAPIAGAEGPSPAAMTRVDDFRLADQDFLARRLHKMGDAKAIVLFAYAAGDKTVKADAPTLMARKTA